MSFDDAISVLQNYYNNNREYLSLTAKMAFEMIISFFNERGNQ